MVPQWSTSDAWVFSSIEGTGLGDGSTLAQVIAKADGINHAILTEAEFTQAIPRLIAAGVVGAEADADRYWLTESGQAVYRRAMRRRGLFGWIDSMPAALRKLGEPRDTKWHLPTGAFKRATREYSKPSARTRENRPSRNQGPGGRT
jgi:hypothetical protein